MNRLIFTLSLLLCFVFSCEKEVPVPQSASTVAIEKAGDDCVERGSEQELYKFELCGTKYTLHVTLEMFNFQHFHRVQSIVRCYKRGGDPVGDAVDFAEIGMAVNGNLHILCAEPVTVADFGPYHRGGSPEQVYNTYECNDCGYGLVTVDY